MRPHIASLDEVAGYLQPLIGQPCTRREIGEHKSLSLGFGPISTEQERKLRAYRSWELRTYRCAWRFVRDGTVLLGIRDANDPMVSSEALKKLDLGRFVSLYQVSNLDLRLELESGVHVDFFTAHSDEDESFYLRCPEKTALAFSACYGWRVGPADRPWTNLADL